MIIYDIGACVGHWTREAKKYWSNATFFLFDANDSAKAVVRNRYGNYFDVLLSDTNGQVKSFYRSFRSPGGNSVYKENTPIFTENDCVQMTTRTLDSLIIEHDLPLPHLIKMDVQGSEIDVLKGAQIALFKCQHIILEAQHKNYNEGAPKADEVIRYMKNIGYELVSRFCDGVADADYHFERVDNVISR